MLDLQRRLHLQNILSFDNVNTASYFNFHCGKMVMSKKLLMKCNLSLVLPHLWHCLYQLRRKHVDNEQKTICHAVMKRRHVLEFAFHRKS